MPTACLAAAAVLVVADAAVAAGVNWTTIITTMLTIVLPGIGGGVVLLFKWASGRFEAQDEATKKCHAARAADREAFYEARLEDKQEMLARHDETQQQLLSLTGEVHELRGVRDGMVAGVNLGVSQMEALHESTLEQLANINENIQQRLSSLSGEQQTVNEDKAGDG